MINSTSENRILCPEDSQGNFNLHCPSCAGEEFKVNPLSGKDGEYFVRIICRNCGEHLFFQTPYSLSSKIEYNKDNDTNNLINISYLQKEWDEWVAWKKRHLKSHSSNKTLFSKFAQFSLVFLLCGILLFFILDRWHLLDPFLEFPEARQKHIIDLAELLLEVPCLPSIMKSKITTVPIKYTREHPVHKNFIQYGEAGIYWGEEHIKIHRSNFWFFGLPKKTQLLNTLVHELRHRSNPGLGHNSEFYKLVKKDLVCVGNYLNELK